MKEDKKISLLVIIKIVKNLREKNYIGYDETVTMPYDIFGDDTFAIAC